MQLIQKHPTVKEIYAKQLIRSWSSTEEEVNTLNEQVNAKLAEAYNRVSGNKPEEQFELDPPENIIKWLSKNSNWC